MTGAFKFITLSILVGLASGLYCLRLGAFLIWGLILAIVAGLVLQQSSFGLSTSFATSIGVFFLYQLSFLLGTIVICGLETSEVPGQQD